jgi:putative ABC transport system permease protein
MKFRGLIFANLFRKKTRLVLTLGSFAVALFLFGLLATINNAFSASVEVAGVDRLVVTNRTSIIQPLPLSYRERIMQINGVKQVTFISWFGGYYQDERNFFANFAIDTNHYREVYPENVVTDEEWKRFTQDRQGAIVGAVLSKKFGWKVGDKVPLRGTIFAGTWDFNIDAIYHGRRPQDDESGFMFQWDYLNERMPERFKGNVGWYAVQVGNPDDSARIAKAIDREFSNSPSETRTDTEKNFAAGWVKQMGNIRFLITTIGTVVFFTLLLVTGNTMASAVRERVSELAVLKAIGYSDRFILLLVLTESVLIAGVGGTVGLLLAKGLAGLGDPTHGFLPLFYLPLSAVPIGLGLALAVGIASGLLPAISAMRLRVVDALRRV